MNLGKLTQKYRTLIKDKMAAHNITTAHDERSHFYVMNGQKYPSVTAKLQLLKDEGLMNWKMNKALEYMAQELPKFAWAIGDKYDRIIDQAKLAPVKEFEGAGSIGTAVHDWRERWFSACIEKESIHWPIPENVDPSIISGCRAIQKFVQDTGYIPLACEMYLADPDLNIGGTLDDIGIFPNPVQIPTIDPVLGEGFKTVYKPKLALVDLKTSNIGDKTSYFLQVALYYLMFKKLTGITIQEFYILHVSKTDGSYKLIPIKNIRQLIKDAKILLKLNDSLARINQEKKKEPIII